MDDGTVVLRLEINEGSTESVRKRQSSLRASLFSKSPALRLQTHFLRQGRGLELVVLEGDVFEGLLLPRPPHGLGLLELELGELRHGMAAVGVDRDFGRFSHGFHFHLGHLHRVGRHWLFLGGLLLLNVLRLRLGLEKNGVSV